MKVIQINVTANSGSTGYVAEGIAKALISRGHEALVAYGRNAGDSAAELIKIGAKMDERLHMMRSLLFDAQGLGSAGATRKLIRRLEAEAPDLLVLHNLHGYYLNYPLLFDFIKAHGIPVAWVLHDCWAFTGHCAYFDRVDCQNGGRAAAVARLRQPIRVH